MKLIAMIFVLMTTHWVMASEGQENSSSVEVGEVECQFSVTDWSKRCNGEGEDEFCLGERVKNLTLKTKMYSCVPEHDPAGCEGAAEAVVESISQKIKTAVNGRESNVEINIGGEDFSSYLLIRDLNTQASSSMSSHLDEEGFEFVDLWAFNGATKVGEHFFCSFAAKSEKLDEDSLERSTEKVARTAAPEARFEYRLEKLKAAQRSQRVYSPARNQLLAPPKN